MLVTTANSDLASDRAALLSLRATVGGSSLLWNLWSSACNWTGVLCVHNRVVELRLPGKGLSGQLPIAIGNLTQLRTLSLRFNALSGLIPSGFAELTSLRNLYLQGNQFSGDIPEFLFSLQNLVRLNLANNNFTGTIPASVNNLTRLATLHLENNHLSGSIPDIGLPTLVQFNVSFNRLYGSIPKGLSSKPKTAFEGNPLCGEPLVSCNGTKHSGSSTSSDTTLSGAAIADIVAGCRDKAIGKSDAIAKTSGRKKLVFFGDASRFFDLEDLLKASAEVLGKGTFGTAYKATMEMGVIVAVNRLKDVVASEKEFKEKMEVIGAMNHPNFVPMRAYYFGANEKLVIYDYMPMGRLSALLHGNKGAGSTPLNWNTRCGIALGAARGIAYLHSKGSGISHGNIKSSNVPFTMSYDACVSDFGLVQFSGPSSTPNCVDGYRAPEVTDASKVSQKADVYSFGILLLELLTAEVFDPKLERDQNVEKDMIKLLQLAVDCTVQYPNKRPSMSEMITRIEELH
ncbi:RLK902 protein [Hibiscus syriacus]|uniref:RLK902 protein n=1 Tax=Hibiscus syriacus TaxID=106335 RepID=A0A6A3AZJ2_HIBSY|nr:RLK902 protein [Hibiscus syriacus]